MPSERGQFLAGRHVPQFRGLVETAADQQPAVRREDNPVATLFVTFEALLKLAGGDIPDLDGPVLPAAGGDELAVRAEGMGDDRFAMVTNGADLLAGGHFPDVELAGATRLEAAAARGQQF